MITFIRLLATIFVTVSLSFSACNAKKQLFSGSHAFNEDEPTSTNSKSVSKAYHQQHGANNGTSRHHNILLTSNSLRNNRGPTNKPPLACPLQNVTEVKGWGIKSCAPACTQDDDCKGENYKCSCDGPCGPTCNRIDEDKLYCGFPGRIDSGRILVVGKLGLYDYRNQLKRFSHNQKIIFECDPGYIIAHGATGKICRDGLWLPIADNPQCIESDGPSFRWIRSARRKRKAIKTGGGTYARTKGVGAVGGGSGSSGLPRRGKPKNSKIIGDDDFSLGIMSCRSLDHDPYMLVEVTRNGDDTNNTFSVGAVAKISCTPGFGVNLNNETVTCEKGKWKPKLPQCSALPCRVPYVIHGTFYVGSKPLFFQELKPHDMRIELRCSKGYMARGPNRMHCVYGEWEVPDAPECVPAGCRLPHLEKGMYLLNYKGDMIVTSGTEIDYVCDDNYQKPHSAGAAVCDHGTWVPATPKCIANSHFMQRNFSIDNFVVPVRQFCGLPPKEKVAIAYTEGTPLNFESGRRFSHGMEVMYRCVVITPKIKNRWKITCDDGKWIKSPNNITCEENITVSDLNEAHEVTKLINSSCTYKRTDPYVATYYGDQEVTAEQIPFPTSTVLMSRCVDIGKFQLKGAMRRKCISGQWMGITPTCEGLSQYHDYAVDKSPTILFRFFNGSIAQTVEGKLIVYPGTTLHMECLYLRKFGRPSWQVSNDHRLYDEGWTDGIENRDPTLEYRLTIDDATEKDSGIYRCSTPTRHSHEINIIVKKINCPPLSERDGLIYSTNSTKAGTKVTFQCTDNNTVVGNKDIHCQASGSWSGALPRCENVECADISVLPAMAPLAYTEITRNGTLQKNETAPPKITIQSRSVGGKVLFSCPQGFVVEGSPEAVCQSTGEWSDAMPLCKEVECQEPPMPDNGYIKGEPPYKAGDIAHIECNEGFILEGQSIIACQDNAFWSRHSTTTKCAPACTYPGTTIGGTLSSVKFYYPIGESVEYNCTTGYKLVGEKRLKCLKSAKWSHTIPNCVSASSDRRYLVGLMERDALGSYN